MTLFHFHAPVRFTFSSSSRRNHGYTQQTTKGSFLGNLMPNWFNIFSHSLFPSCNLRVILELQLYETMKTNQILDIDLLLMWFWMIKVEDLQKIVFWQQGCFPYGSATKWNVFHLQKKGFKSFIFECFTNQTKSQPLPNLKSKQHISFTRKKGFIPWQQYLSDHASWTTT